MAPLDDMSDPGTASYDSDTMTVGDGTWDFTKNDFLLPNLVGLNFDTMQYNGMGNRFATMPQYHSLVKAHGIIAVIVFLFIVPIAIFYARFYTRRPGYAVRYHAYLNIAAVLLTTAAFVLGWFAVGPKRSLTNPHHGIGVAIYTLILVQIIGGRLIKNIRGRSLRVMLHQWFGRAIALLGIIQVPLGLTLYGSPKYTFVLFAVWMAFLMFLYFIFEYRADDRPDYVVRDGRSEVVRRERKSGGGTLGWLGPLALAGAAWALLRGGDGERSRNRSRSRSRVTRVSSRSRSRSRPPEVIPSRHQSYVDEEKFSDRYSERPRSNTGGGFMHKALGVGAGLGAAALISRMMGKREPRRDDEEYSAVSTDTPSRTRRSRSGRRHGGTVVTDYSEESEEYHGGGRRSPLLPGPGRPSTMAAAMSAAEARPAASRPARPITPEPSHYRGESMMESTLESDYSSYVSPSRRSPIKSRSSQSRSEVTPVQKGLLAGVGLGWFAKKMRDRRESKEQERMRAEEEDRRAGRQSPRYTGDGYSTPPRRRDSHHVPVRPADSRTGTSMSHITEEESSLIEPRPISGYEAHPPLEPLPTGGYREPATASRPAPPPMGRYAPAGNTSHSRTQPGNNVSEPTAMPPMPEDPRGILAGARSSESDSYVSRRDKRRSESRNRAGQNAADAAAATAGMLAAEEEAQRRAERGSSTSRERRPVSVKVKVHDDKDRNVTLRRLTEEETLAARRARRRRNDSASSLSGSEAAGGSRPRYRREQDARRAAEESAESAVEEQLAPLSPPAPAFAGGRRPKDSAYYSGQPPQQPQQQSGPAGGPMSSLGSFTSPDSHGTWSGMSPIGTAGPGAPGPSEASAAASASASAADRRRRRRLERRDGRAAAGATGTVDFT
ncbi:hypothetical protein SLS53_006808 [Cytospora paraplurivora]|uniref:Cytochrome b561 domain-containing protein n=1 Tax=Cytospora paraplurivora TaxID=2898453 RepID=A0AAN9U9I9_9PEZI